MFTRSARGYFSSTSNFYLDYAIWVGSGLFCVTIAAACGDYISADAQGAILIYMLIHALNRAFCVKACLFVLDFSHFGLSF
jgi:hypothetical protein